MADLIGNKRLELTCAWMNGLSVTIFATGVVLPIVNLFIGIVALDVAYISILSGVCLILTITIHWLGKELLGELDDTE